MRLPIGITEVVGATPLDLDTDWSSPCRDDLVVLDGRAVPIRLTGRVDELLDGGELDIQMCGDTIALTAGPHRLETTSELETGIAIDQVVVRSSSATPHIAAARVTTSSTRDSRTMSVPSCSSTCLVEGFDGWNAGWSGDPRPSASGRNVWVVSPARSGSVITTSWTPQTLMWIGLTLTAFTLLAALLVLLLTRRATDVDLAHTVDDTPTTPSRHRDLLVVTGVAVAVAATVSPVWALVPVVVGAVAIGLPSSRRHLDEMLSAAGFVLVGLGLLFVLAQQIRTGAEPGFGWPSVFARGHRPALTGIVMWGLGLAVHRDSLRRS